MSNDTKNRSQFLDIYGKYSDELFRYSFFKTGNREISLEIVQEVFMKVWNAFQKQEHPDNIKAFLYTSVRNAITDWYRKKKPVSLDVLQEVGFDVETEEASYSDKFDIEKILEKANDLEEMYREIIILRFVNDLSVKEIARLLNERENNISVRIHRAVDKLKKTYEQQK